MVENRIPLWLACRQRQGCHLEIGNNAFEQGVPVFYDDGCIESLAFNSGTCRTNSKSVRSSMSPEPCKEQTVAISFAPVAVITHVKQHVKMLFEKNIEDGKNGLFNLCIMWRTLIFEFLNDKLESVTTSYRLFGFKGNQIMDVKAGGKNKITIRGIGHLVWRLGINCVKGKFYHNETTVPVNPIAFHSSAMRCSALRLISSERLKRAKASSYVIFFVSISSAYLTFLAAKISNNSETTNKKRNN